MRRPAPQMIPTIVAPSTPPQITTPIDHSRHPGKYCSTPPTRCPCTGLWHNHFPQRIWNRDQLLRLIATIPTKPKTPPAPTDAARLLRGSCRFRGRSPRTPSRSLCGVGVECTCGTGGGRDKGRREADKKLAVGA